MKTFQTILTLRQAVLDYRILGKSIAFVPTMGNLHEGHMELIRVARMRGDIVVASIFVNPLQFGANEDFDSYPNTLEADKQKLIHEDCDILFAPSVTEMYPQGQPITTQVSVKGLGEGYCGESRPGHFEGVATVVTKLFNIVQPDIAFFGEKDYQQLAVIKQLTFDLSLPVEIIGVPTQRNEQGLALSSRNGYLTKDELSIAWQLNQTIEYTHTKLKEGNNDYSTLEKEAKENLTAIGFTPDYFHICQQDNLQKPTSNNKDFVILAAAWLGKARLIDNRSFSIS